MSNNNKYKPTSGIDEIHQLLEVISPSELIRVVRHMEQLGLIDIEQSKPGEAKKKNK